MGQLKLVFGLMQVDTHTQAQVPARYYRVPLLHPTCIIHYSLSVLYRGWYCGYSTAGMLACCLLLRCRRAICSWTLVLVIERVSSNLKLPLAGGAKVVQLACGGESNEMFTSS